MFAKFPHTDLSSKREEEDLTRHYDLLTLYA